MIPAWKEECIRQLLKSPRNSRRKIARIVGVSRATVGSIANGTWNGKGRRRKSYPSGEFEPAELHRCLGCGYNVVYRPCRICWNRRERARQRGRRDWPMEIIELSSDSQMRQVKRLFEKICEAEVA